MNAYIGHPCNPEVFALPLANPVHKAGEWALSSYTILEIDFANCYCITLGNSANIRPNLKLDT